jgi:hypothetical protein
MNVLITRLVTGEEILGEVELSDCGTQCCVSNPTHISAGANPKTGNVDIHMAPYIPLSSQKKVTLSLNFVLCQYEPVKEIVSKYKTMHSGIILPNASGVSL